MGLADTINETQRRVGLVEAYWKAEVESCDVAMKQITNAIDNIANNIDVSIPSDPTN